MNLEPKKDVYTKEKPKNNTSFYNSQTILRDELLNVLNRYKKENRGKFSLNDFSKKVGIAKPSLSAFFNGRHAFKKRVVLKKLKPYISEKVLTRFLKEVDFESLKLETRPDQSVNIFEMDENGIPYLTKDQKEFTSDPLCFALIHLFDLEDFDPSLAWMASRLRLSVEETKSKLELLVRLKLLEKRNRKYISNGARPVVINKIKNRATILHTTKLNQRHTNFLNQQLRTKTKEEKSSFQWWYFSLDPNDIDIFSQEIISFTKKFQRKQIESKPKKIYALKLGLFPLLED